MRPNHNNDILIHHHSELFLKEPSLSLLYPDTAPRHTWRPQLDAWMKKNHPDKLKQISQEFKTKNSPHSHHSHHIHSSHTSHSNYTLSSSNHSKKLSIPHQEFKAYSRPLITPSSPINYDKGFYYNDDIPHNHSFHSVRLPSPPPETDLDSVIHSITSHSTQSSSKRRCISCGSDQSPCWRPSWSITAGQLCNSCGLRYKKTGARCLSINCGRIPAKGEWITMKRNATKSPTGLKYTCLSCGSGVEVTHA
jgi:hypothetical protein